MKTFKFRYTDADGKPYFKRLTLPNDAALLIGFDSDDREIYNGDIVTSVYDFDDDGLMQEYAVSADLAVTFTDERGKTYGGTPEGFKCVI